MRASEIQRTLASKGAPRARRPASRRWCVPPAIMREPEETLEYSLVLSELPGDLALLAWNAVRDVTLWARVDEERRAELFDQQNAQKRLTAIKESQLEVRVALGLTSLTAIVASPATVSSDVMTLVCMDLSRWAEERAAFGTAVAFAQAAALIDETAPAPAARVGGLALRWGRRPRAETWLRRTIGLSRRAKDWHSYASAYVDLGTLYVEEDPATARRYYIQAARAARRHGLLPLRGYAMHGLLRLSIAQSEFSDAQKYASAALRAYRRGHSALPDLMLDISYLWVLLGTYDRAINGLRRLLVGMTEPARRARTLAILARAGAGAAMARGASAGQARETYRHAWSEAWMLITGPTAVRENATILLDLAHAAATMKDMPRLEQVARLERESLPYRSTAADPDIAELVRDVHATAARLRASQTADLPHKAPE